MDFEDTPEQARFRARARAWLRETAPSFEAGESRPGIMSTARDLGRAKRWQAAKADAGWAGIHWPLDYGGQGLSSLHAIIYESEESRYRVPSAFFTVGLRFCAPTLMAHATEEQRRRYLPRLLRGEEIWCQLFSEPGAGSDLAGLRTRARRDGDEWVVDGQKIWTTYAHVSDFGILVTRHDPTLPKHRGLTYFFVDMHSEGIETRPIRQIAGPSNFNEVFFSGVRVPDAQRMGEVGDGWQVAMTTLLNERLGAASAAQSPDFGDALDLVLEVASESGRALDDPSIRGRLADWFVQTQALDLINRRMITSLAKGDQPGPEASIRKLVAASKLQAIADFGMELQNLGGVLTGGFEPAAGALFQNAFLASPGGRIAGGSDEILRNIIAERVLDLPGDVRIDRDRPFKEIPA